MESSVIMNAFKQVIYSMNHNYQTVLVSDYFEELPPKLKQRLLDTLTYREK